MIPFAVPAGGPGVPSPAQPRKLLRNISSNYAVVAVNSLLGIVLTAVLFRSLRPANYAVLILALTVFTMLELLDFGVAGALLKYVSELHALGQPEELRTLMNTAWFLLLAIGAVAGGAAIPAARGLAVLFRLQASFPPEGTTVIAMVAAAIVFQLPAAALYSYLGGLHDFASANGVEITVVVLRTVALITAVYLGAGLLGLAAIYPAAAAVRMVGLLWRAARAQPSFFPNFRRIDFGSLGRLRGFATLQFAHWVTLTVFHNAENLLAAWFFPLPQLALLAVARRLPWGLVTVARPAIAVAYPLVSSAHARGDMAPVQRFIVVSTRSLLAVLVPLALALYLWCETILRLWAGSAALPAAPLFRAFVVFALLVGMQDIPLATLFGLGRLQWSALSSALSLASGVALAAWGARWAGIIAVPVAFAAVQTIVTVALFAYILKHTGLGLVAWLRRAVLPAMRIVVPAVAWIVASYHFLPHGFVGMTISFSVAAAIALLLLADWKREAAGWPERLEWLLHDSPPET
jgi:O-antigen/teichoic acid export membrane protein